MKYQKRLRALEDRIKDWQKTVASLAGTKYKDGHKKPGSQKKT